MSGFVLKSMSDPGVEAFQPPDASWSCQSFATYEVWRPPVSRFQKDAVFYEDDDCVVVTAGYLLNREEFCRVHGAADLGTAIAAAVHNRDKTVFRDLRGSFSGFVYIKADDSFVVYTNHTGDNGVFYRRVGETIAVASRLEWLLRLDRRSAATLDQGAAYAMLTYGFMVGDQTMVAEIKRLRGGEYLSVRGGKSAVQRYHMFGQSRDARKVSSMRDLVEGVDVRFRTAVAAEFDKDLEHGTSHHLVDLSGGMDSRMTTWVAHDLGYRGLVNVVYSQFGYADMEIAGAISSYLGTELISKSLDDARFLLDIEELVRMNGGAALYSGITGGKRLLESLNLRDYGMEHTGQLGGVVVGSFIRPGATNGPPTLGGLYSHRLAQKLDRSHLREWPDMETYMLYQRGFNGTLSSHLTRRHYIEVASPFLDVEFLEYCLSAPLEVRSSRELYTAWVTSKYPGAARFRWEKTNARPDAGRATVLLRRIMKHGPARLTRALGLPAFRGGLGRSMNPFDYWWAIRQDVSGSLEEHFSKRLNEVRLEAELASDVRQMFVDGNALEKTQALTVVQAAYWIQHE